MRRAVVTGIGTVGAAGAGFDAFCARLEGGALPLAEVEPDPQLSRPGDARLALALPAEATREWIAPLAARRMGPPSRMAVAAARMAARDAGLEPGEIGGERTAVCLGTAWGSTTYTARLLEQLRSQGATAISPMVFTETVANAPAGQIALDARARGPNGTLTQREASALLAVARGAAWIASGRADRVLAGAVDELSPVLFAVLARFGALEGGARARPFDARRSGLQCAEGATVLVLEAESLAAARGARVRARVAASASANDPSASASDWGRGSAALCVALRAALARAGIPLEGIGRVVSGANGSRRGDALEAALLAELFGAAPPPVLAPKSLSGEYGGNFLAASLWALGARAAPSSMATAEPDPALAIAAVAGPLPPAERALVCALAAGGAAAFLVWEKA